MLPTLFGQELYYIARPGLPWTVLYRMCRELRRPKAEAIVVLACQNNSAEASLLEGPDPLTRIEGRWVEQGSGLVAITPFLIGKCVYAEVNKRIHLHFVPSQLLRRGQWEQGCRGPNPAAGTQAYECYEGEEPKLHGES